MKTKTIKIHLAFHKTALTHSGTEYAILSLTNAIEVSFNDGLTARAGERITPKQAQELVDCTAYEITTTPAKIG